MKWALPTFFALAIVIVLLSIFGKFFGVTVPMGLAGSALAGLTAIVGVSFGYRLDLTRRVARARGTLEVGLAEFSVWLIQEHDRYCRRRAEIRNNMEARGASWGTVHVIEQVNALVEYTTYTYREWLSTVGRSEAMLLADAGKSTLNDIDSQLAERYRDAYAAFDQRLRDAKEETHKQLAKLNNDLAATFLKIVDARIGPLID